MALNWPVKAQLCWEIHHPKPSLIFNSPLHELRQLLNRSGQAKSLRRPAKQGNQGRALTQRDN
jgi:hypothetical protein